MFEAMEMAPPDAILGLTEAFKNDLNPEKISLSVGVYKDDTGTTPILECVKQAESRIIENENSKSYLGIDGLAEYGPLVRDLIFGEDIGGRAVTLQTPGGTGALRVSGDFLKHKVGASTIWLSNPTWANHGGVFNAAGLNTETYTYLNESRTGLDFQGLLDSISQIPGGDVICLHACCHNPTGVDPTAEQWDQVAALCNERGILPLVDFAYQGFGNGITEDAAALIPFRQGGKEFIVCSSFSKNFGLYGERIGALTVVSEDDNTAAVTLSHAKRAVRTNYSNPPKHGGAIVSTVLSDEQLRSQWESEVAKMRNRINDMRDKFVKAMQQRNAPVDFGFIQSQRGMFSFSGLNKEQVDTLRNDHSIYIVGSGRINVAGLTDENLERFCDCVMQVL